MSSPSPSPPTMAGSPAVPPTFARPPPMLAAAAVIFVLWSFVSGYRVIVDDLASEPEPAAAVPVVPLKRQPLVIQSNV